MLTRREALLAAGAGLVVVGCGGRPARTVAGDPADLRILQAALDVERRQVAVYEAGLKLSGGDVVRTILAQERRHVAAIEEAIRELGGSPAAARPAARMARARDYEGWKQETIGREQQWAQGYAAVLPRLKNTRLRSTFAALMTTEAEHAVALDVS